MYYQLVSTYSMYHPAWLIHPTCLVPEVKMQQGCQAPVKAWLSQILIKTNVNFRPFLSENWPKVIKALFPGVKNWYLVLFLFDQILTLDPWPRPWPKFKKNDIGEIFFQANFVIIFRIVNFLLCSNRLGSGRSTRHMWN